MQRRSEDADLDVHQTQDILRKLGYDPGPIGGLMSGKTREALRQFQRDHRLTETGQIDAATKAALQQSATKVVEQPSEQRPNAKESPPSAPAAY